MSEQNSKICADIQNRMHFATHEALQPHLQHCVECQAEWRELQVLLGVLEADDVEPMRAEFAHDAFAMVREHGEQSQGSFTKPLLGLAASILLVGLVMFLSTPVSKEPYDLLVTSPVHSSDEPQNLRIAFNSPGELSDVGIEIILPEGLGLAGSEMRTLSWKTKLHKGKNELRLPLLNTEAEKQTVDQNFILARLTHAGKVKEFRVRLLRTERA